MKGKGKGKEASESKDCPLQFPDLTPVDALKECKVYASIIDQTKEDENFVHLKDLDNLQFELEAILVSVMKRQDNLEEETEILTAWQEKREKKPFAGKSQEAETSGKRSHFSEGKPSKKYKDNSGKAQPSPSVSRPKTKNSQAVKLQEYDSVDSPIEGPKPLRTDAPNRFWASLEPYFADITVDHIKFLEDWVQVHDDDEEYFKIPPLGKHYAFEWANRDIQEEQKEGMKASEKKKGLSNNCSLNSADPEKILMAAEKDGDSEDNLPLGPLAQRLVSCLIEEKIMPSLEDTIDTTKEIAECPKSPHSKTNFLTSLNINNTMELEKRIRKELEEAGILDPKVEDAENPDDAVLAELKEVQASLKIVTEHNLAQKKRLLKLAKEEVGRQEVVKKLQYLDSEIMDIYRRKQKRKCPSKKEREQTFAKLKERESLVQQLESMGNFSL